MIYGNVISINVMLATHASETLSRTESRLTTNQQDLMEKFEESRNDIAKIIKEIEVMKEEMITSQEEARQETARSMAQMQERLSKADADTAIVTRGLSGLSVGIASISTSVISIRSLGSQILALLRVLPAELGSLVQSVIRSDTRMESVLLRTDRNIAASPALSHESNIRIEDALGRIHDMPFEWFRYWKVE